jgi:NAD+ diphosphatase
MSLRPVLAGGRIHRDAERRDDAEWLAARWSDRGAKLLVVDEEGRVAVDEDGAEPRLVFTPPDGDLHDAWLLGTSDTGDVHFARAGSPPRRTGTRLAGLRDVGADLPAGQAELLATAVALANWHRSHPRCPRCGSPTQVTSAGFSRRCPQDGSVHFPRTDPAVIVLVTDGADRCLLGRRIGWPTGRYSTLAGFVEAGESAEAAVAREILEEAGVAVLETRYQASQPWPFPASLMLGFTARADPSAPVAARDEELADVAWFHRDDFRAGSVRIPPPVSIAHALITGWLGDAAPELW